MHTHAHTDTYMHTLWVHEYITTSIKKNLKKLKNKKIKKIKK